MDFRLLSSFLANVPILYPLKTPENLWFFGVFRRYKMGTLAKNGLCSFYKQELFLTYKVSITNIQKYIM